MTEVADKKVINTVPKNDNDSLERITEIFNLQKSNLQALKNTSTKERRKKLKKIKNWIFDNKSKIQDAVYKDFKKPATETDIAEIYPVISELKHAISHLDDWMESEEVDVPLTFFGSSSYVQYEPKGNCLAITPWNYPFFLAISPIIYAIAAGNACILKPSEFTPNASLMVKEMLGELFNENEIAVILGDYTVSSELLKLKFNHIHFTGSPSVGKIVMKAASQHLSSCTLELGGKSPVIVDETANIKEAATKIVWGKYLNEGQICIAPDYLYVHKSKKEELLSKMKEIIANNYGNSENERRTSGNLCNMVNSKHFTRVSDLINNAVENGANVEIGGEVNTDENFIDPTILTNVSKESKMMEEEIFGPVLPLFEYENIDDVLTFINSKEKPLALYIFSKKNKNINKILNETSAGGTCINETLLHVSQPHLPFGGVNNSGIGKSHGKWGFVDFSNERAVLRQHLPFSAAQLLHPPYTKFTQKMIDLTMKWF